MPALNWIVAVVLAVVLGAGAATAQDRLERLRQHALDLVNDARAEAGLPALSLDGVLNEAAQGHAADMLEREFYSHVSPGGETAFDRFRAAGGSKWSAAGENIAKCTGCQAPADEARIAAFHEGWMQSPAHRDNILSAGFDSFGFGVAGAEDEIYAVQTFSGPGADAGDGETIGRTEIPEVALQRINEVRSSEGHDPLQLDPALNTLAERLLQKYLASGSMPQDVFGTLPEGSGGWTSLSLRTGTRGGSGTRITRSEVSAIIQDWRASVDGDPFGGTRATHLGFAMRSSDEGRTTALAVFGGRR